MPPDATISVQEKDVKDLDGPNCPPFFQVFAQFKNHNIYTCCKPFLKFDVTFATSLFFFLSSHVFCLNDDAFATSF